MVRFSSNLKRPKAISKQSSSLLSKEAPTTNISSQQRILKNYSHAHTRSLPSNSSAVAVVVQEIGLTSEQALKKLIEEIDRLLKEKPFQLEQKQNFTLRYSSLLLLATWSIVKFGNWSLGLFCIVVLFMEFFLIEIIEKRRATEAVRNSIKKIRKKMRQMDKSLLAGSLDLETLYSIVI